MIVDLTHTVRTWHVNVYPFGSRPTSVSGIYRPANPRLSYREEREVSWPGIGRVELADARLFMEAIGTASRILDQISEVIGDASVDVKYERVDEYVEVAAKAGPCSVRLRVEPDKVVQVDAGGDGEIATLFRAWVTQRIEENANYLRGLSDKDIAALDVQW